MRDRVIVLLGAALIAVIAGLVLTFTMGGDNLDYQHPGGKPISEQSCHEIAKTLSDIEHRPASDLTLIAQEIGATRRIDQLGGCPNEPSLGD